MRTKAFLSGLLLFVVLFLQGQTFEWVKRMGGTGNDYGKSIATDAFGNVYTTGYFTGTGDFDPGPGIINLTSIDGYDIFVSKTEISGSLLWVKRIGGVQDGFANSIAVDDSGNVYVSGDFSGTTDFNPGTAIFNLTSTGLTDVYLLKLDASGNFIYAKAFGGAGSDYCYSMALDDSGKIYMTGCFSGSADFDPGPGTVSIASAGSSDIFISKTTNAGSLVWAKSMGGTGADESHSMALDNEGNIYTTGFFSGSADFDPGIGTVNQLSAGLSDIFISKLDSSGNIMFAKRIGGIGSDDGQSIMLDAAGNAYLTGFYSSTVDFDPGSGIVNLTSSGLVDIFITMVDSQGNYVWAKRVGGSGNDKASSIAHDASGNIYVSGWYNGLVDFDPGTETFNLTSAGFSDAFITKMDSYGNFHWAKSFGGTNYVYCNSIAIDIYNNVLTTGYFYGTADFDPGTGTLNSTAVGGDGDIYFLKLSQKGIGAFVYYDYNQNCIRESNEAGLSQRNVLINPGNIIVQTNDEGFWYIDSLPVGTYTITADPNGSWLATCPLIQPFNVDIANGLTYAPNFGLITEFPCTSPEVSIFMPSIRPCFSGQVIYVSASNNNVATGALINSFADVELDTSLNLQTASLPFTNLGNNVFRFELGDINPGQCVYFNLYCQMSCFAVIGQTVCMDANIYPVEPCVFDTVPSPFPGEFTPCTLPWDHSSLQVDGYCQNDSIYFVVTNTGQNGNGDMDCFSPVRIYIDGVYTYLDSIHLTGGDTAMFVFAGDGKTWRLEADQHPLHPGNSHPNATVEACGDTASWIPGLVNVLPLDDSDDFVDIYCGIVTGSYDPNDKTGYPTGITADHHIMPGQQLQYVIRFQNTGTDTAFTVIVRDTLNTNLDIFSVVPGVSSHNYTFRMYGPRVLEWTFNNILLPDSNHNVVGSNGFLTFTVNQNNNMPNNTKIYNSADIYFDFNAPVTTNQTMHTVNDGVQTVLEVKPIKVASGNIFSVYPNPSSSDVNIVTKTAVAGHNYSISDMYGRIILGGKLMDEKTRISVKDLVNGVYLLNISGETNASFKLIKQ